MSITRRELFRRAGLLGVAALIPNITACSTDDGDGDDLPNYEYDGAEGPETLFEHGVASGDPLADSVILWTRVSPAEEGPVEVFFEMATDPEFSRRVAADYVPETDASRDYTVKVDVDGLEPGTTYYYRFWAQGRVSATGRTRTAPDGASEHLRFVICSCSSLAHGYFHAYKAIAARRDIDAVLHLGDYIYEYGNGEYGEVREYEPPYEIVTLEDYRMRYSQYRRDADLAEAHRQHPFICTWDDHEITNDGWKDGAENHQPDTEGDWEDRKAVGLQAYFEWLPLREGVVGTIYRDLPYGGLVDIIVLDTRIEGREAPAVSDGTMASVAAAKALANEPGRQLLGAAQEAWCFERLEQSTATWKLLAQQVMMGQLVLTPGENGDFDLPLNFDQWDGYADARTRLLDHIQDNGIDNVVVLTGDIHSSWANELTQVRAGPSYDPETGAGSVAVEFVAPGISSPGLPLPGDPVPGLQTVNPHIKYGHPSNRGYIVLDVTQARVQADWFHFDDDQITSPAPTEEFEGGHVSVAAGTAHLVLESAAAPAKDEAPELAP